MVNTGLQINLPCYKKKGWRRRFSTDEMYTRGRGDDEGAKAKEDVSVLEVEVLEFFLWGLHQGRRFAAAALQSSCKDPCAHKLR